MASDDESVAERVQARKVLLVNLDEVHGREVVAVAGLVHSAGTHETAESSLTSLRQAAHSIGADAVVKVRLDFSTVGRPQGVNVVAYGTAVCLSPSPDRAEPQKDD